LRYRAVILNVKNFEFEIGCGVVEKIYVIFLCLIILSVESRCSLSIFKVIQFTFDVPTKEVFGNSKLLDFKHPDIELDGFTKEGSKEIPFEMGGDLRVFLNQ
jgi:hypothetical protein